MPQPDKEHAPAPYRDDSVYRAAYGVSDGLLADHVIAGRCILPGASMVDLAFAAAQARQRPCFALKDVLMCRPGVARKQMEVEVRWGSYSFTIHEGRNLLCIGRLEERESAAKANILMFDVAARGDPIEPRALYADLDRLGYRYGPGLQVIRSVLKLADRSEERRV